MNIRLKLSDFVGKPFQQEVLDTLDHVVGFTFIPNLLKVYFWYDRDNEFVDLNEIKDFMVEWENNPHIRGKTIIRPKFFDNQNDFINYDIIPKEVYDKYRAQYTRFSWTYHTPEQGIISGLKEFEKTMRFIYEDKPKKQKRNDDESSNHR
jgi:hypothetical protein